MVYDNSYQSMQSLLANKIIYLKLFNVEYDNNHQNI